MAQQHDAATVVTPYELVCLVVHAWHINTAQLHTGLLPYLLPPVPVL